jgi:hypothetical protein
MTLPNAGGRLPRAIGSANHQPGVLRLQQGFPHGRLTDPQGSREVGLAGGIARFEPPGEDSFAEQVGDLGSERSRAKMWKYEVALDNVRIHPSNLV